MEHTRLGLTGNALKIIAMISMLIDHIGFYLFPNVTLLRAIGRIAFPIFAYMIAEGCAYTKSRTRYFSTIAGVGILCQVVTTIVTGSRHMNVLITFALAIAAIFSIDSLRQKRTPLSLIRAITTLIGVVFVAFIMPRILKGFVLDYKAFGVFFPVLLYYVKGKWRKLLCTVIALAVFAYLSPRLQWCSLTAVPLLALYNGKRGKRKLKYLFYVFYPTHLVVIYLIATLIAQMRA